MKKTVSITLDRVTWDAIHARAEKERRTLSAQIDYILTLWIQEHPLRSTKAKPNGKAPWQSEEWSNLSKNEKVMKLFQWIEEGKK